MERVKMKKKGFTLVELLVVIAIIAMLLAILMPALGKVRQLAQRMVCTTNLSGLGKAMLAYSNDDKYESYPISSAGQTIWAIGTTSQEGVCSSWDWSKKDPPSVKATAANYVGTAPKATISSCLYLLVKYADVSPDQFICPGGEEKAFELNNYVLDTSNTNGTMMDVWDFGSGEASDLQPGASRGRGHISYAYQNPFPMSTSSPYTVSYPISVTSNPARPVMADRNPFFDKNRTDAGLMTYDCSLSAIKSDLYPKSNSSNHQKDGQNVLYADQHAKFEKSANIGIEQDNIYTTWGVANGTLPTDTCTKETTRQCGTTVPVVGAAGLSNCPLNADDSFLVNQYN